MISSGIKRIWNQLSVAQCLVKNDCAKSSRYQVFSRRKKWDKTRRNRDETVMLRHKLPANAMRR